MMAALALLAADRQTVIVLAFWILVGAGGVVSAGAWILLRRESRAAAPPRNEPLEDPAASNPAGTGPAAS